MRPAFIDNNQQPSFKPQQDSRAIGTESESGQILRTFHSALRVLYTACVFVDVCVCIDKDRGIDIDKGVRGFGFGVNIL